MDNIKQLEERIAQLTELVKSGGEAIKSMEAALRTAEEERDRLADQRREWEPKPKFERVDKGAEYYTIYMRDACPDVIATRDNRYFYDNKAFACNNYFYTTKRGREVADKINLLLKLERLHDIYCPDYKAEYDDDKDKYHVAFCDGMYQWDDDNYCMDPLSVFFPSSEIAQKVCDILNKESNP